jgi:2-polyprenyl-6-hydroxyphenyl methylase/3-demethylubiquinone-9 3-methyltransferase|tara:strand:- start:23 stop:718 length:696 start_codon:yes stop_codon:yes gene_type:complete
MTNIDQQEVKKFSDIAEQWWNKDGDFKPLHVINPLRANYIKEKIELKDKKVLDVGCGGGLLCESLYDFGAIVTGIDAAGPGIEVAKIHAQKNNKNIKYFEKTAEELNTEYIEYYDVVTCLEVLEHVPDPKSLIKTCVQLLKPGGLLFLSTINKNPRSWITAIVGAEYIFNLLPKGTHEFDKFIKPSSLAKYVRDAEAELLETKGMFYNPLTHKANLNNDLGVNYLMYARKS